MAIASFLHFPRVFAAQFNNNVQLAYGMELWTSNGTVNGTFMVAGSFFVSVLIKDLVAGGGNVTSRYFFGPIDDSTIFLQVYLSNVQSLSKELNHRRKHSSTQMGLLLFSTLEHFALIIHLYMH